jgi:hypothetical protein
MYIVGCGILRLICILGKKTDPLVFLDFLTKTNYRIIFGFIFVVLFSLIFSIFNIPFIASSLAIFAISVLGFATKQHRFRFRPLGKIRLPSVAPVVIVLLILAATIMLSSTLISGFYGSTNDDGADHTLLTRTILDNPSTLLTHPVESYSSFALFYPMATHVLSAFLMTLLGVSIQKIVIMMSAILPCLITLSLYSTTKCLFENKFISILSLIIGAFFTVNLAYSPLSWGGLPLLFSLYLSISSMGLIYLFLAKGKMTALNAFLLGLFLFIASQTYPVALLVIFFWSLLILSLKLLSKFRSSNKCNYSFQFSRKNLSLVIVFLIPLLLSIPYFYSIYIHNVAGHQFSILSSTVNFSVEAVKSRIGFNWLFDIPALSFFFSQFSQLLALASCSLILIIVLFIPKISQRFASIFPSKEFARSLLLVYFFMLSILGYLTLVLYLPINFLSVYFTPERVLQHIFPLAIMLTAGVIFFAVCFSYQAFKRLYHNGDKIGLAKQNKLSKNRILVCVLLALLIFNLGLLSIPLISEQQGIYKNVGLTFNTYETLHQDDISLMKWISENIPSQSRILVSAGDSGQFVTAVTQRQTISRFSYLENYSVLMAMLTSNSSDLRAVPFLVQNNVSYVYIGSIATTYAESNPVYRYFNSTQFLSTPYFSLANEDGNAFLFQFNSSKAVADFGAAGPLPMFVDTWHPSTYINILASVGGYTEPPAGLYYSSGVLSVSAFVYDGYQLDHWILNGSYLVGPQTSVNVDYQSWNLQAIFIKSP